MASWASDLARSSGRCQLAQQPPAGKRGVGDELGVAEVLGQGAELRRESGRLFGESALPERGRQVRKERESSRIGRVEQRLGAAQEVGDRPHVVAGERAGTRRGEPVRGPTGEPSRLVVERPERLSVPERLLEVVADDLVLLLGAIAADASDPRGEPLVQVRSALLGDRLVRGVADQDVAEAERLLAGDHRAIRPHELLADQRTDQVGCVVAQVLGEQVANGAGVELLADHGGALDRAALVVGQAFETSGEERRDRGWDRDRAEIARRDPGPVLPDQHPVVDQHREHLLDEQRVAAGRLGEPVGRLGREARAAEQVRDQLGRGLRVEGLEQERRGVQLAAAPVRSRVEELRARGAHEHDRRVARPVHDVVDDVEERGLGPVDVLPERDERPFGRQDLEEPPDRPRRFLGGADALADAQDLAEATRDRGGVLVAGDQRDPVGRRRPRARRTPGRRAPPERPRRPAST